MGTRSRFVRPETKVLHISDGDTITVRKRLNTGQTRRVYASMSTRVQDGSRQTDSLRVGVSMVSAYLVDWSLVDFDGNKIRIAGLNEDALVEILDDMEYDDFEEIRAAINEHVGQEAEARTEEKKRQDGVSALRVTSLSLVGATGDTSGSQS
jgi:hypothetical protein